MPYSFPTRTNGGVIDASHINALQDAIVDIDTNGTENASPTQVRKNSAGSTFTRKRINFIEGTNTTFSIADDSANEEIDVTINSTATGSGGIDYKQSADPGAVGAAKTWLDTDTGELWYRNAANTQWLPISAPTLNVKWFGAKGDGSNDDTTAIQACFDAAHVSPYEPLIVFPAGNYKITATITYYAGSKVRGMGSGNTHSGGVKIIWAGAADTDVFVAEDLGGLANMHATWFENIGISAVTNGVVSLNRFRHGWNVFNRGDLGTRFEGCGAQGGSGDAFYFPNGGINVVLQSVRCDYMLGGLLYFHPQRPSGNDSIMIRDATVDNVLSSDLSGAVAGHGLHFDMTDVNGVVWVLLDHIKLEINAAMTPGTGMIMLTTNPNTGNLLMHHILMQEVWSAHNSSLPNEIDLLVTPATSMVEIVCDMCQLRNISGIPNLANSLTSTGGSRSFRLAGKGPDVATAPGASDQLYELFQPVNFATRGIYRYGKDAAITTKVNPTSGLNAGTTVNAGDRFETVSGSVVTEYYCNLAGTVGTLSSVTGSGASGQNVLTVNSAAGLQEGQYISIVGANTGVRITRIWDTMVVLASNLSATVSGAAVSYRTPTFLTRANTWT